MANRVNIYIAREIAVPFLLGLTMFTCILLMGKVINLTELVVGKGVPLLEVVKMIIYMLPTFFVFTIPMAFLMAIMLAFGRLSNDEEITALKSSGLSIFQLMPSVMVVAAITMLVSLFFMIYALPWGTKGFRVQAFNIASQKADTAIVPGRLIDAFENLTLHISDKDKETGRLKGIFISEEKRGTGGNIIVAKEGELISLSNEMTIIFRLYEGTIHNRGSKSQGQYKEIGFSTYDISLKIARGSKDDEAKERDDKELMPGELLERSRSLRAENKNDGAVMVEFHKKFAIPFSCIFFALIAVPLGIQGKRSGKGHGFIISLILIVIYWVGLMVGEALGQQGNIPPAISLWSPNIIFMFLGIYLIVQVNSDREIKLLSLFEEVFIKIEKTAKGLYRLKRGEDKT